MPGSDDKELIKNVRANRDQNGRLLLGSVCDKLKEQGFSVSGTMVSYYSPSEEMYIFIGKDPIPCEKDGIPIECLNKNRLLLKFRPGQDSSPKESKSSNIGLSLPMIPANGKGCSLNHVLDNSLAFGNLAPSIPTNTNGFPAGVQQQVTAPSPVPTGNPPPSPTPQMTMGNVEEGDRESSQDPNMIEWWSSAKANRRTKERKISFVIEKVSMWRKLYNGIQDQTGKIVRYSLEDAAKKVGISKKSLDDYLLQLRYGKKFGFDFNENKESKIGVLRAFVKKKKQEEKEKDRPSRGGNTSD
jgi:hypothetical protein